MARLQSERPTIVGYQEANRLANFSAKMEYDRALFRVYERILEDLNGTPSPMALASSTDVGAAGSNVVSSPRRGGLRRRRRQEMGSPGSGDSEESEGNDPGSPESERSTHSEGSSRSRGRVRCANTCTKSSGGKDDQRMARACACANVHKRTGALARTLGLGGGPRLRN